MSFRDGLLRARSHIVFILGLTAAFGLVLALERWAVTPPAPSTGAVPQSTIIPSPGIPSPGRPAGSHGPLTAEQRRQAGIAWAYFEANLRDSGLVDAVAGYPATTLWDTGSYLLALIAAERLGVIDRETFDARTGDALRALARLPLVDGALPNEFYDTRTLAMTDYDLRPTERGIGWSALDIGRALVPLSILVWNYPEHGHAVGAVIGRWRLDRAVSDGFLYGVLPTDDGFEAVQEGRLGYEEYAARAFAFLGRDTLKAQDFTDRLGWAEIHGVQVPIDTRYPEAAGAHTLVTSEPYMLYGLEFGLDGAFAELAYRVYRAQERRYEETAIPTAVGEDHLDRPPRFVYGTVIADGEPWAVITPDGRSVPEARLLSTKTAFAFDALYGTAYASILVDAVSGLFETEGGWYSGRYERTGETVAVLSANTNAVILEALHYRAFGPMADPAVRRDASRHSH